MARKTLTKPRKNASQERSRATVDALVEATARILVKEGFDKASTNRIAEKAGVSIGSLYQYFPTKEALVAAVIDRHHRDLRQVIGTALTNVAALPLEQAVRTLATLAIQSHRVDPQLHCVLAEQIPRTGRLKDVDALIRQSREMFRSYLEIHRKEIRDVDPELAAFVCVTTIEALSHAAVLHHPEFAADGAMEELVDEATRLVVRYLR
jgi:AcrR family transcriptional regulator